MPETMQPPTEYQLTPDESAASLAFATSLSEQDMMQQMQMIAPPMEEGQEEGEQDQSQEEAPQEAPEPQQKPEPTESEGETVTVDKSELQDIYNSLEEMLPEEEEKGDNETENAKEE